MKHRLLEFLACPQCQGALRVTVARTERMSYPPEAEVPTWSSLPCTRQCALHAETGEKCDPVLCARTEIVEGELVCDCGRTYPIREGIPRMLPEGDVRRFAKTQRSFGFQWLRYISTDPAENRAVFVERTGAEPASLRGLRVLDAGCGMGRFLHVCASGGAEVVGVDLSAAVDRASRESVARPNVHVVQGNLMRPPFRREVFDFAYSIGVLHHTPNAREAFLSVAKLVRRGGRLSVWVYVKHAPVKEWLNASLRAVTTRMPLRLLYALSLAGVPIGWGKLRCAERRWLRWVNKLMPIVGARPRWQDRWIDTFDWYSAEFQSHHTPDEVKDWFHEAGFRELHVLGFPVSVIGVKA